MNQDDGQVFETKFGSVLDQRLEGAVVVGLGALDPALPDRFCAWRR